MTSRGLTVRTPKPMLFNRKCFCLFDCLSVCLLLIRVSLLSVCLEEGFLMETLAFIERLTVRRADFLGEIS